MNHVCSTSDREDGDGTGCQGPHVGIVMGSQSDWPTMRHAFETLNTFPLTCEVDVVSAHRCPEVMLRYGQEAASRGLRVIIAGAGGAAHLPGMLASVTSLPVIGVPISGAKLDGLDSLLSIVQMPAGIPVATVAVNGATNAALLAARIVASGDSPLAGQLREQLRQHAEQLREYAAKQSRDLRAHLGKNG